MVSKLLLAAVDAYWRAVEQNAPQSTRDDLAAACRDIRNGLGDRKSPREYGVFPMDPYSHTPGQGGARRLRLEAGSLAFTYCQVPVVYRLGRENRLIVHHRKSQQSQCGHRLDPGASRAIQDRNGEIIRLIVEIFKPNS